MHGLQLSSQQRDVLIEYSYVSFPNPSAARQLLSSTRSVIWGAQITIVRGRSYSLSDGRPRTALQSSGKAVVEGSRSEKDENQR